MNHQHLPAEYNVTVTPEGNVFRTRVPAFPTISTFGASESEAVHAALDAIERALENGTIPPPSDPRRPGWSVRAVGPNHVVPLGTNGYPQMQLPRITRTYFGNTCR